MVAIAVVIRYGTPIELVGELDSLVKRLHRPLNFFLFPHEPISGPNPVESPSQVLKLLLPEPITVSGGVARVI